MRIPSRAARRLAVVGLLGLAGLVAPPARGQTAPPEKTLPATTLAYIKIEDASKFREAFRASQLGRLIADPAMKPIKDDIRAKMQESNQSFKQKLGVTLPELFDLPRGTVSIALVATENNPEVPFALVLTADAGANEAKMREVLDRTTQLAEKDGSSKVSTETFQDLKLTVLRSTKVEEDKPSPPIVWTKTGSTFFVATDLDVLKDVLGHAKGRDDALAAKEPYGRSLKKVGEGAQLLWYIDAAQVLKLIGKISEAQGQGNAAQIDAQLQITGLNGLKAIAGSFAFNVGDFDQLSKVYIDAPGPAAGLLKIFSLPRANLTPQPWVPESAATYQSISWDLDNAYGAIDELANMFAPGVLDNLQQQIAGPDGKGIDFRKDVFGPLGDRITVIRDYKKKAANGTGTRAAAPAGGAPQNPQRVLAAVALEDAKAFQNTLNKVIEIAKAAPKKREFQGTTIYDFEVPEQFNTQGTFNGPISAAIARDTLFVSPDSALLEQVLRQGGPSLADSAEFRALSKLYPETTSTLSFQRAEEQARILYDMVKSGQLKQAFEAAAANAPNGPDLAEAGDLIDPEKLPDFSVFAKYLAPGGGFGVMEEGGMTITQFTRKKPTP